MAMCVCSRVCVCVCSHSPFPSPTQRSAPSDSRISLWSMRIARQHSENSAVAEPLMRIKQPTQSRSAWNCGWQTCQTNRQHPAPRAEGRKTTGDGMKFQHKPVDWGVWHGIFFPPRVLLIYPRDKPFFAWEIGWYMRGVDLVEVQIISEILSRTLP